MKTSLYHIGPPNKKIERPRGNHCVFKFTIYNPTVGQSALIKLVQFCDCWPWHKSSAATSSNKKQTSWSNFSVYSISTKGSEVFLYCQQHFIHPFVCNFKKNVFLAVRQVVCGSSRLVRRAVGGRWTAGGAATCISLNGDDRDDGNGDDDHHPTRFSEVHFVTWRNLLKIVGSRTTMICKTSFSLIKPSLRCS